MPELQSTPETSSLLKNHIIRCNFGRYLIPSEWNINPSESNCQIVAYFLKKIVYLKKMIYKTKPPKSRDT